MRPLFLGALLAATAALSTVNADDTVNQRRADQQKRVAEGAKTGKLSPHETHKIEKQESKIHHQVHKDRVENGGETNPCRKS